MRSINLKKIMSVSALGLVTLMGTSMVANAQRNRDDDRYKQDDQRNERRISQEQQKLERQRVEAEAKRVREEQQRQAQWQRTHRGQVYNSPNANQNQNQNRYRIYRNGRYYNTDNRGADLLRQAVNQGYQQGYQAGQSDKSNRRRNVWTSNNVYRTGTYGYQNGVDRSQYQYYFQQGFQRGYQDGYNSRNQYGNGGSILGDILGSILNIQTY